MTALYRVHRPRNFHAPVWVDHRPCVALDLDTATDLAFYLSLTTGALHLASEEPTT